MRNRETLEFLGLWESLHNPDFKPVEFDGFRSESGLHAFTMSPTKWIENVNAILIDQGKTMSERLILLRGLALKQMETLSAVSMDAIKRLPGSEP